MGELWSLPGTSLARMIADGETTSVAVTKAVLAHTRAVDAALNAFAHIAEASALEAAHAADLATALKSDWFLFWLR